MNQHEETIRRRLDQLNQAIGDLADSSQEEQLSAGFARGMMDQIHAIEQLLQKNISDEKSSPQLSSPAAKITKSEQATRELEKRATEQVFAHISSQQIIATMAFVDQKCVSFNDSILDYLPSLEKGSGIDEVLEVFLDQVEEVIPSGEGTIAWFWEELLKFDQLEFRTHVVDSSGQPKWLKVSVQLKDRLGTSYISIAVADQTELEQSQKEVEVSREFHRSLINSIPDRFFITDRDHCVVMCNEFFAETVGLSQDEIIGRPISRLLPFRFADQLRQHSDSVLENSVCNRWETCWNDPVVNAGYLSIRQSLFTDIHSGDKFVVSTAEDTNQFHQNQIRLNLLANAYNNGGEGIVVMDQVGRLLDTNPAFQALSGTKADQLSGRLFTQMFRHDKNLRRLNALFKSENPSQGWSDILHLQTPSHADIDSRVTVNPVHSTTGNVIGWVAIVADLSDVYAASQRLKYQAYHDPLTGLASRPFFNERLTELLQSQGVQQFALFFLDLDDFKLVNDTAGHSVGDQLLQEVGSRLRSCLSSDCLISRFGGDEFAILVPDTFLSENDPGMVGQKIVDQISKPFDIQLSEQKIGVSVGVSLYPQHGSDINMLMRNADSAMYRAKTEGKNQVRFYSHSQSGDIARRMNRASQLRQAIGDRTLKLSLQEFCLLESKFKSCHLLALTWSCDGIEVDVSQLAEETRLAEALGEYLLDVTGQYLKMENDAEGEKIGRSWPVSVVVRLTQRQLRPDLAKKVQDCIDKYGFDPEQLEFLIPEQLISQQCDTLQSIVQQLAACGVRLTVENFGTGHSSISFLKTWGIDAVSIDPRFIRNMPVDRPAKEIVDTILSLAHRHQVSVYAQGVRSHDQKRLLEQAGCKRIYWHSSMSLLFS